MRIYFYSFLVKIFAEKILAKACRNLGTDPFFYFIVNISIAIVDKKIATLDKRV